MQFSGRSGLFADVDNWREEQLSEGFVYSTEWRVGCSPIDFARVALKKDWPHARKHPLPVTLESQK